jgi:hypothetical protein
MILIVKAFEIKKDKDIVTLTIFFFRCFLGCDGILVI